MSLATSDFISASELEQLVLDLEPNVVFVPRTILRRVVRRDARLTGLGLRVPHSVCYTIGRDALLRIVDHDELGLSPSVELPERVILIRRPEPEKLAHQPRPVALLFHWRVLFHARVHLALESRAAAGVWTAEDARQRWRQVGDPGRREIVTLLNQEHCATADDPISLWIEFAAFYLGLRSFNPDKLRVYFPGLRDFLLVDEILAADVDADGLLAATRLPGAADPGSETDRERAGDESAEVEMHCPPAHETTRRSAPETRQRARGVAARAASRGNDVRAAILMARAGDDSDARAALDRLVERLRAALPKNAAAFAGCRDCLAGLLDSAARGFWPQEARLLYDLQTICIDVERPRYKMDLIEWLRSLGRRPIQRLAAGQREVLVVQHLRTAFHRLPRVRLNEEARGRLSDALREALRDAERHLRETFRPTLSAALIEVGLLPSNLPERAASHKIVEELLDRIDSYGLLTISDLRDALSRNDLKLNDLGGPIEFIHGDRLLRLDCQLAASMESVYRRGEFYLRGLQRFSALAFGTPLGRFLMTWLALPFGGAYVVLEGLQHLAHLIGKYTTHFELELLSGPSVVLLGLFLVGILNFPGFRRRVGWALHGVGHAVYWLLISGPRALLYQPLLVRLYNSTPVVLIRRYLIKPAFCAGLVWLIHWQFESAREWRILWTGATFLLALVVFNTRVGRSLEELITDRLIDAWHHLGELFPAVFRFVMWVFKAFLQGVDRLLYTVDEWLRFRQGEGRATHFIKTTFGAVWSAITYVIRFALTLLIEPQINPIKHFPVVTVAHKVMLPFIPTLAGVFVSLTFDKPLAYTMATVIITCTPGLFGFLVWELKENYRLYAANRSPELRPVLVGSHGETVLRLMRPGFHSGTVPKAFARLRRAVHRTNPRKRAAREDKQRTTLHHVEEALQHFVEFDLLYFLDQSGRFEGTGLRLGHIVLGLHSIQIQLTQPAAAAGGIWVEFEEGGGRLTATIRDEGLLGSLDGDRRRVLRNALIGFYKKVGVTLIRTQVAERLDSYGLDFRVTDEGLVVTTQEGGESAVYDLDAADRLVAQGDARLVKSLPVFTPRALLFRATPLTWLDWVNVWECEQSGYAKELMSGLPLWEYTPAVRP
jgi:hypothetical protein